MLKTISILFVFLLSLFLVILYDKSNNDKTHSFDNGKAVWHD